MMWNALLDISGFYFNCLFADEAKKDDSDDDVIVLDEPEIEPK